MTSGPKKLTIDDCLDIIPLSYFQYRLLILCGVLFMADAMEVILLSFLTACAGETFHLNDAEMSSITSVVFLGQLIGTCFWGPFADLYGRRAGYLCACAMTSVFGILSGLSPNYPCLLTFRSLVGFGIAGLTGMGGFL
jgi:MFS family permease